MQLLKATNNDEWKYPSIFLAGSIEMGIAENWQDKFIQSFSNEEVTLLSPRRDDWDSTWEQNINFLPFKEQVEWELNCIEKANCVVVYFDKNTKSPITLLELGLVSQLNKRVIVCCPEGFWRKGNVDIICQRYAIELVESLCDLINSTKAYFYLYQDVD